jgi:hypothetical protein
MINNISTYSSLINTGLTTTNKSEVETIIEQHKENNTDKLTTATVDQSNLYLSSRAQKINAISEEFFSGDTFNFNDVESLKERVYQLGLISKNQYTALTNSSTEPSAQSENSTLGLTNFIGNLLERLQSDDNTQSNESEPAQESEALTALIKALEAAKEIISNIDEAKRDTNFKTTLNETLSLLKQTIEAPTFEQIPLDDKVALTKVYQTLEIVDQLSPQRLNNEKLNKYIDFSLS